MSEYIIETSDLVKIYEQGNVRALNGLDLKIKYGEIYAFIGANGSGKSTTINLLNSILYPTSGTIKVFGLDIPEHRHEVSQYIGMTPQEYSIYLDLTVEENIMFFGKLYNLKSSLIRKRMDELLDILQMQEKIDTLARNLSGGQKRRVSIACALIHHPKLLFLDEATVGVDPVLRDFFWKYFRSLRDDGITLVVTSHVMDEAEKADRIGLIKEGKLIAEGTPEALKEKYNTKTIEEVFIKLSRSETSYV